MARRIYLSVIAVAILAMPAAVSAASSGKRSHVRAGVRSRVHAKRHVIAVRRGRHIHWYKRAATRIPRRKHTKLLRLSRGGKLGPAIRPVDPAPAIGGVQSGFACGTFQGPTSDSFAYIESYAPSLYSDMLVCSLNNGGNTMSHTESTPCFNPYAQSAITSPFEDATFMDGESVIVCNTPDDNGAGGSQASSVPYTFYRQGFTCQATVGIGADGNTADNIKNQDSIEFHQDYSPSGGGPTSSITTACVGQLPHNVTPPSQPATHVVGCSQYNPFVPGGVVRGLGLSASYPDGQYSEVCNTPNYSVPQI